MASSYLRSLNRISLSSLRPQITKAKAASGRPPPTNAPIFRPSKAADAADVGSISPSHIRVCRVFSRSPVELGSCVGSMYPLHSVVAAARLTSLLSLTSQSSRDLSQGS